MEDMEIVGIVERNKELVRRYVERYGIKDIPVYESVEKMLHQQKPEGVMAFGSIYEHLEIVEACAPRGVHVMVEKPLAVSVDHATKMEMLAREHGIHLITNYETTWYPTNHAAYEMTKEGQIGEVKKILVNDGHRGPKEIGVSKEFMEWLGDPVLNGGGALVDFGCYGANLMTWLMDGEAPKYVTAFTATNKPEVYPEVDDEATILLQYRGAQGVIQASWNWPFSRKDMEVYGETGYIESRNKTDLVYKLERKGSALTKKPDALQGTYKDPFAFFSALIRGEVKMGSFDPSSLENNLMVVRILEAAKTSAETGKRVEYSFE